MKSANPNMILLARESRGWTQQMLSEKINSYKANLSRLEKGDAQPTADILEAIAEATGYPVQFFYQRGDIMPTHLSYRKKQNVPSKIITPIEAQVNIMRMHIEFLTTALDITGIKLPAYCIDEKNTPASIASSLRADWNIHTPVIPHLTQLLEGKGILIYAFDFGTTRVDSKSIITSNGLPLIFLNATLSGDRQRFSLAYELGHLIMHSSELLSHTADIVHEANVFAAEFLMPAGEIIKDFESGITLSLLGELKRKWKVSMISLLYRADDLGLLTPNQKRYLLQQFNQQKIRRREPQELDIAPEQSTRIRKMLADYRGKTKLSVVEMAALFSLEVSEYLELYS
jgi:Zn-dependent peptidase ImmA (M78 family)/transcriptional regulator with XRE-family HTH domain